MNRLPRSRRSQRGAALLMVTVVITLLTIVGAFAVRSTGKVTRAAGQARHATATRNIAELGIRTAAAHIAVKPPFGQRALDADLEPTCAATFYQQEVRNEQAADGQLELIDRCAMVHSDSFFNKWKVNPIEEQEELDASAHPLVRKFVVDFTDETDWGATPGEDAGARRQSKRATVHVRGVVGPYTDDLTCGDDDSKQARGRTSTFRAIGTLVYRAQ